MGTSEIPYVRVSGTVTGLVQGVSFRWFVQRHANELGVTGWVRNESDGAVRFLAEGLRPDLDRLLDFLRTGPSEAAVENVATEWATCTGEFHRFEIRY